MTRGQVQEFAAGIHRHRGPGWIGVVGHQVKGAGIAATRSLGINRQVEVGAVESVLSLFHGDHRYVQQAGRAGDPHIAGAGDQEHVLRAGDKRTQRKQHGLLAAHGDHD
jgi:hypothetical protein